MKVVFYNLEVVKFVQHDNRGYNILYNPSGYFQQGFWLAGDEGVYRAYYSRRALPALQPVF